MIAKGSESGGRKRIDGAALLSLLDAVLDALSLRVIAAGGIATARGVAAVLAAVADGEDAVSSTAFTRGMPQPGPHRVLRGSIAAAEALDDDLAGVVRPAGVEIPVPRFAPLPPTRESTGRIDAMPSHAGRSAGAVTAVQPAADVMAELCAGVRQGA